MAFTSDRYGYSIRLPAGWYIREEGFGDWHPAELNYVGAGTDSFEEDYPGRGTTADFPGITFGLYVSAAKPERGTTPDGWIDQLATAMQQLCLGTPERESTTIGSESARLLVYDRTDCRHDQHVVVAGVLHGGMGYALTWLARAGQPDGRRGDLNSVFATFRFTR